MNLTLVAVSLNDQPLSQPITTVFDARGGTIGRADHNTMALPDPQRHVSRLQAEVIAHGDAYLIRNVGAANPIVVGSRTLAYGDTARLDAEVPIRIGGYLLRASGAATDSAPPHPAEPWFGGPGTVEPLPAPGPPAAAPAARGSSDDPFAGLLPAAGAAALVPGDNPFADLLNPPAPQPAPPAPAARSRTPRPWRPGPPRRRACPRTSTLSPRPHRPPRSHRRRTRSPTWCRRPRTHLRSTRCSAWAAATGPRPPPRPNIV
ncbi:hypothetical protein CLD22_14565, partial [Rubrivivax gelatinosus]|nr:hypothetical protein [Rubrivivax gelatinosus]